MAGTTSLKALLFTDIVGSTRLSETLGNARWAAVCARMDERARALRPPTAMVLERTDGYLIAFELPTEALRFAFAWHAALRELSKEEGLALAARAAIHTGEVALRANPPEAVAAGEKPVEMDGAPIAECARAMSLAAGGQTLLTRGAFDTARKGTVGDASFPANIRFIAHGPYLFKGMDEPVEIFEAGVEGEAPLVSPRDSEKAHRALRPGEEELLGWRPAAGQEVKRRPGWILESKLGEGGFGEVWLARNERTREARVFKFCFVYERLKSLKRELTLFLLIKEALGQRPDIQRLYDLNFDEPPYFLEMDYARGGDLIAWSDAKGGIAGVPLAQRLEFVAQVADAVGAAHSIGILHKDVKPQNILIEEDAGKPPQAKLTDFGIGQLADKSILDKVNVRATGFTESTLRKTELSSRTGTRLYMAPELFADKPPSIQSDVYALGVLLYQMIACDFARPASSEWEKDVADPLLREDLRLCLAGDPAKRLKAAGELAERLRTLPQRRRARRRKLAAKSGAYASLVLAVLLAASLWWLNRERERAEIERGLREAAQAAERAAEEKRKEAELNLAIAREQGDGANDLVTFILRDLKTAMDEELTVERGLTVPVANEIAHAIAGKVATPVVGYFDSVSPVQFPSSLLESFLESQLVAAKQFGALGRWEEMHCMAEQALESVGESHESTLWQYARAQLLRGEALRGLGRPSEAIQALNLALQSWDSTTTTGNAGTIAALNLLGLAHTDAGELDSAESAFRLALEQPDPWGPEGTRLEATVQNNAGLTLHAQGRFSEACHAFLEAADLFVETNSAPSKEHGTAVQNTGRSLMAMGRIDDAIDELNQAVEELDYALGPNHPQSLQAKGLLASSLVEGNRLAEAVTLLGAVRTGTHAAWGPSHPESARIVQGYAKLLAKSGRLDEALQESRLALEIMQRSLGRSHPATIAQAAATASHYRQVGRFDAAISILEEARGAIDEVPGDAVLEADILHSLGSCQLQTGELSAAEPLLRRARELRASALGPRHPNTLTTANNLALLLLAEGQPADALPLLIEVALGFSEIFGSEHPNVATVLGSLAQAHSALGEHEASIRSAMESLSILEQTETRNPPELARAYYQLSHVLYKAGSLDESIGCLDQVKLLCAEGGANSSRLLRAKILHLEGQLAQARGANLEAVGLVEAAIREYASCVSFHNQELATAVELLEVLRGQTVAPGKD